MKWAGRKDVNVWCDKINNRKIVGPHIFEYILTGEMYLNFLEFNLPALLADTLCKLKI